MICKVYLCTRLKDEILNYIVEDFNTVLYSLIGEKIRKLRTEKELSQTQLSDEIPNIGRTSISNIEKGKQQPPLHVMYLICNVLDIDIHSILPTYSDIVDKMNSLSNNDLSNYIINSEIDEKTREVLQELLNLKPKK